MFIRTFMFAYKNSELRSKFVFRVDDSLIGAHFSFRKPTEYLSGLLAG